MTTLAPPRSPRLAILRTGAGLAALIAVIDIGGMFAFGIGTAPIEVTIITSVLAATTLVSASFAWRRAGWAIWTAALTRLIAAMAIVPILIVPEAPKDAIPMAIVMLVLTLIAAVLLFTGLPARRR